MKLGVGLPLILSVAAFVLSLLALLAGKDPGFMEDYHIVVFNTSALGQNVISNLVDDSSSASSTTAAPTATSTDSGGLGGFFSSVKASATAAAGSLESDAASILNDIGNDIADRLADELGISEFYGIHVMDVCHGNYTPNATTPNASYNVTNCTAPMDFSQMNISHLLDKELSVGPFNLSLSDLGVTQDLQDKLNDLPKLFEAMAVMYILGVAFSGLSILGSVAGFFSLPYAGRKLILLDFALACLAMLFLLVGNLVTTIGGHVVQKEIIDKGGDDIGLNMYIGKQFLALSWAAFGLMALATFYWVYEFFAATITRRRTPGRIRGMRRHKDEKPSLESRR